MASPQDLDLNTLPVFAAVAERGGFTAAADQLGMGKARVSQLVARLEAQLGQSLFARTTRRVTLTEAGQALYEQAVGPLRSAQDALAGLAGGAGLAGTLRIAAPVEYAGQILTRALPDFARAHPQLQIDLRTSERVADMLKEGIDISLRLGWLRDSSQRAVRLAEFEQHVLASPAYLRRAAPVAQPRDLAGHEWVALQLLPSPLTWRFTSAGGQTRTVRVAGRVKADSVAALRGLLAAGWGVSVLDQFTSAEALRAGRLVRLLPNWSLPKGGLYAVFPPGRHVPAKARAFLDFYRRWLAGQGG